ncbi:beta-lactamase [Pseudopedobacter saltans DSM 12145]|uniref:Beta-lactamase n=1 Tax=Pseudopedobacter saltans (strain ATCC 51119 / DSM 12145 / JCM 21818 / CCUG 39354 / LMG 10337 / NBRC 100064 / NCIMB 13643) TaxID=762903 RepID=F0SE63_PSESL|nr:serine hydrolase [Pseudopedobacter saltans]ADY53985.1 beta-lactamase [Pseudopedobacter saltans DSM 12145]
MLRGFLSTGLFCLLLAIQACGQEHKRNQIWVEDLETANKNTVVLNNGSSQIPLIHFEKLHVASLNLGFNNMGVLDSIFSKYKTIDTFSVADNNQLGLVDDLKLYNQIVVVVKDSLLLDQANLDMLKALEAKKNIIIAMFGKGSYLQYLNEITSPIIWSSSEDAVAASLVAQIICGGRGVQNKLEENYSPKYVKGMGDDVFPIRLAYSVPEEVGINSNNLSEIDKIVNKAIDEQATPGAVVLVAVKGKVIYNKAFGHPTYQDKHPVEVNDIYDLASITKIAATTMASMKLYEEGKLKLDDIVSNYISRTKKTDKANIKIKDILLHQAGFIPFIPFYQNLKPMDYSRDSSADFSVKVADSFFLKKDYYKNVMWKQMLEVPLKTPGKYVYSDLSMYYMKEVIEGITGETLPKYVEDNFYKPLGMDATLFNPRNRFDKSRIIPTEKDEYFRKTLLWGYVHDQGAAMAGGVAGHAGLFSIATDLATLGQMLLNKGAYGSVEYFKPQTVELFTSRQSSVSRRGLGFDRWDPDLSKKYPSELASPETFGHTGYTGTCFWVDPARELIYVFLSNRVNPKVTNTLLQLNVRSNIQDVIYKAINNKNE